MKKILLTALFACALYASARAQKFPYSFVYSNEPYVSLSDAVALNQADLWDVGVSIPLGFDFQFGNVWQDHLILDGYTGGLFPEDFKEFGDSTDAILPYTTLPGFIAKFNTVVRYTISGDSPNQIAKIEFYRVGFDGVAGEVSFQVWLYETFNAFQFRYGSQTVPNLSGTFYNKKSPLIGYLLDYYYISEFVSVFPQAQFVVGSPAAPTDSVVVNRMLDELVEDGPQYGLSAKPLINSVYTFTPGTVATHQPVVSSLRIEPNPAHESVQIVGMESTEPIQVQIINEQGRLVSMLEMPAGVRTLKLPSELAPGLYLLRSSSEGRVGVAKLMKI